MITIESSIITQYADFVAGSVQAFVPIIGMAAGIFLAFAIFDKIVRLILKTVR